MSNLTLKGLCYAKMKFMPAMGEKFKAKELQNYFNWREWYDGIYEPSDATDKKISKNVEISATAIPLALDNGLR
ncbi:MAG: hypothetical protein ACLTSZ_12390 [Lachnospiraceae bacterium]